MLMIKEAFEYNWNRTYDPYNFNHRKISWIEYNKNLDGYLIASIYKDDFSSFVQGINSNSEYFDALIWGIGNNWIIHYCKSYCTYKQNVF